MSEKKSSIELLNWIIESQVLNFHLFVASFYVLRKSERFRLGERNNKAEDSTVFFRNFLCNIKIRKPFKFGRSIRRMPEIRFHNIRRLLYSTSLRS